MAAVATTKLFENDRVIVWEMVLEPGESTVGIVVNVEHIAATPLGARFALLYQHAGWQIAIQGGSLWLNRSGSLTPSCDMSNSCVRRYPCPKRPQVTWPTLKG